MRRPSTEAITAAENVLRQALVDNYDRSGIETQTGTLRDALSSAEITVKEQEGGIGLSLSLPDRERPCRWEGDKPARVSVYGSLVFGGRPGITVTRKPMVFRGKDGGIRRTHQVGPAPAHDISLTDQQVQAVGNALTEGIADQFEKEVSERFR